MIESILTTYPHVLYLHVLVLSTLGRNSVFMARFHHFVYVYVLRSSGMSHMSGTIEFEIYDSIGKAIKELSFAANPIKIGLGVLKIWTILSG